MHASPRNKEPAPKAFLRLLLKIPCFPFCHDFEALPAMLSASLRYWLQAKLYETHVSIIPNPASQPKLYESWGKY